MPSQPAATPTRDWLDAQYNVRALIPNAEQLSARRAARSRAATEKLTFSANLAYGPHPRMVLELAAPPSPPQAGAPVVLFIHGGYWQQGVKEDFRLLAEPFVAAGVLFVNVEYALAPEVRVTEIVQQVRQAVLWCRANLAAHGGDPAQLHVCGHSAGGHLTAELACTDWAALGAPADTLRGVCPISGLFDLEPIRRCYLNDVLHLDKAEAAARSPLQHLPARGVPMICAVGGAETEEFLRQNREMHAAWQQCGFPAQEIVVPGANHLTVVEAFADPSGPLLSAFLTQILG